MAIFHPEHFETCSNETALVTPIYDISRQRYVLFINESLASIILNSNGGEYNCYYQEITRDRKHDSYDKMERKYFSQNYEVPLHVEGLILTCHRLGNESDILQSDAYNLIQYRPPPKGLSLKPSKRKPSVLMFGIDSLSRINLRRTMPKVYKFLTRDGWFEQQGYNKIGDNTFPNLLAILTGYNPESAIKKVCNWHEDGCLDRTPFIWHYFRNASYLTAYAEDEAGINTFNYWKPGFLEQPTDFYLRPLQKAIESGLNTWKCSDCSMKYCIGRRITSSYAYDMARNFANRFVDERPIWGLFWSNSFSHDSFQMPSKMEDYVLQYLLDFEADGVFDQSIMVFLSDHGSRYGRLMSLPSGFLEERLPSMFIYLPPWFRAQYPEYARALELNRNRLTSNYDLHNTLKHIIELGGTPDGQTLPKAADCPKCQSLFYPVDETRSCEDAGIPEHFCTCVPYKRLDTQWAKSIAPKVIGRINEYLAGRNLSKICSELTLSYIHLTEMKVELDQNFHDDVPRAELGTYRTMFKVKQNSADFRATVIFNNVTDSVEVEVPTISRLDSYENVSTCVKDKTDKMYCICKCDIKDD
nr:RE42568p [Drosophila melanogaster]